MYVKANDRLHHGDSFEEEQEQALSKVSKDGHLYHIQLLSFVAHVDIR